MIPANIIANVSGKFLNKIFNILTPYLPKMLKVVELFDLRL